MSTQKTASVIPQQTDLAFSRDAPYGTVAEPTYSGALSFLRRPYSKQLDDVDVAIVGVPFDLATSNRPGTRLGPRAIRAASAALAWAPPCAWTIDPCEVLRIIDWGDGGRRSEVQHLDESSRIASWKRTHSCRSRNG